jgi:hypothetical protein
MNGRWLIGARSSALGTGEARSAPRNRQSAFAEATADKSAIGNRHSD